MTKIIQRHDTAANWTTANPVLAAGEIGVEYGEPKYKFSNEATINNTVTIDANGNATFGSDNGYISFNSLSVTVSGIMEYTVAFTTGSDISTFQDIVRTQLGTLNIQNNKLQHYTSSGYQNILSINTNTYYRIRVVTDYNTLNRVIYNDVTKEQLYTYTAPTLETLTLLQIGSTNIRTNRFLGTIHLSEFSLLGDLIFTEYTATKFKIGDGTTAWNSLAYAAGEGSSSSGTTLTSRDGVTTYSKLAIGDNLVVDTGDIPWTNPKMTSNSQDGYVASASSDDHTLGAQIWKAFDKDTTTSENTWYTGNVALPQWIMLECPEPVRVTSCMIMNEVSSPVNLRSGYIQGSNDGSIFGTLYTIIDRPNTTGYKERYTFNNNNYYKYLRIYITEKWRGNDGVSFQEVEFKGFVKDPAVLVPTLNVDAYTKTETDNLLNTKQDKLTAVSPIRIYDYTPDYTYTGYTIDKNNNLTYIDGEDNYILFPYNKNNLYIGYFGPGDTSDHGEIRFDYGKFLEDGSWQTICITNIWGFNIYLIDGGQSTTVLNNSDSYNISSNNNITHSQMWFDTSSGKIQYTTSEPYTSNTKGARVTITNKNYTERMNEITHVRFIYRYGNKNIPYKVNNIKTLRYYNIGGFLFDKITNSTDRTNIFLDNSTYPNLFTYVAKGKSIHKIEANPATTLSLGVVQPDGTSITISEAGVISGQDVKTFTGYSDTGTLVLKSINGVLQWVAEG